MPFARAAVLALALTAAAPAAEEAARSKAGVVFVIGGVGGKLSPLYLSAHWALPHAEVPHELRDVVWSHGTGMLLRDLQDIRHLLAKAAELADAVREVKAKDPTCPVYFLAHSGGCGVALAAAELLPAETLERIVLLSAAVSPTLDLRLAAAGDAAKSSRFTRHSMWFGSAGAPRNSARPTAFTTPRPAATASPYRIISTRKAGCSTVIWFRSRGVPKTCRS